MLTLLLAFLVAGIGWWFLGQWLRSRGYSEKLDSIGKKITIARNNFTLIVGKELTKIPKHKK